MISKGGEGAITVENAPVLLRIDLQATAEFQQPVKFNSPFLLKEKKSRKKK